MRRRELFALAAGAAIVGPASSLAQATTIARVGVLVVGSPGSDTFWRLFQEALRARGYVEGRNIRFEFRSDGGQEDRLPALAAELVRSRVDVIVTWFTPAATAAKQATRDIPIVMAVAGDPVATGLVENLSHPGGNITGMAGVAAELSGKIVEFIHDLLPSAHRVAALVNMPDPFSKPFLAQVQHGGKAAGIAIDAVAINRPEELDAAFAGLAKNRPDAIVVQPSLPIERSARLALDNRLPAGCALRAFAEAGGLLSYWFAEAELYGQAADYVIKILHGAKPAELPVQQPTKFELVVNLKTAEALGITVPQALLMRADEVIQ